MVRVEIIRTAKGDVAGFHARGHAGFARRGSDIVCAAVSVLTHTAIIALPRHAGVTPQVTADDESGDLSCFLPEGLDAEQAERAQIILESMVTGLREVAREYGKHVRVKEVVRA